MGAAAGASAQCCRHSPGSCCRTQWVLPVSPPPTTQEHAHARRPQPAHLALITHVDGECVGRGSDAIPLACMAAGQPGPGQCGVGRTGGAGGRAMWRVQHLVHTPARVAHTARLQHAQHAQHSVAVPNAGRLLMWRRRVLCSGRDAACSCCRRLAQHPASPSPCLWNCRPCTSGSWTRMVRKPASAGGEKMCRKEKRKERGYATRHCQEEAAGVTRDQAAPCSNHRLDMRGGPRRCRPACRQRGGRRGAAQRAQCSGRSTGGRPPVWWLSPRPCWLGGVAGYQLRRMKEEWSSCGGRRYRW